MWPNGGTHSGTHDGGGGRMYVCVWDGMRDGMHDKISYAVANE